MGPGVRHPTASWEGRLANAKCSCWAGTERTLGKGSVDMALGKWAGTVHKKSGASNSGVKLENRGEFLRQRVM